MIIVAGDMNIAPAMMADFAKDVAAMRPKVLAEDGCSHYSLLVEDYDSGLINVMEIWRDDAALGVHFTMPWIAEFFGKYGGHMTASSVQIYDVAGEPRPLPSM